MTPEQELEIHRQLQDLVDLVHLHNVAQLHKREILRRVARSAGLHTGGCQARTLTLKGLRYVGKKSQITA
jgi:hypothetical protein